MSPTYSTNQVSKLCHVTKRQLQWWDEAHLLNPKIEGMRRLWSEKDLQRVQAVRQMRQRGVPFAVIFSLLMRIDRAGLWLITGTWSRWGSTTDYHWSASEVQYCPDEEYALKLAAKIDGPVLLIAIQGSVARPTGQGTATVSKES